MRTDGHGAAESRHHGRTSYLPLDAYHKESMYMAHKATITALAVGIVLSGTFAVAHAQHHRSLHCRGAPD